MIKMSLDQARVIKSNLRGKPKLIPLKYRGEPYKVEAHSARQARLILWLKSGREGEFREESKKMKEV